VSNIGQDNWQDRAIAAANPGLSVARPFLHQPNFHRGEVGVFGQGHPAGELHPMSIIGCLKAIDGRDFVRRVQQIAPEIRNLRIEA